MQNEKGKETYVFMYFCPNIDKGFLESSRNEETLSIDINTFVTSTLLCIG